ncbi:MAG TPA: precorrin-6y C5,15-methyltransferase (decarboxylating) subunit CbiE [Streptosporangiaceae bacterium]|nr:precorrin-6y C5,15-methyltransferase (decarboxylating) subunit CbiE [Streptosporangiaceae bacterium]
MITVVGMDGAPLGAQAQAALTAATLVLGARRHLATVPVLTAPGRARTMVLGELAPALDALAAHQGDAVVLASGDPGFFGIVRALGERGLDCTVLPAVSCVALAFARAGLPWDDAAVVSAHGRDPRPALNVCRAYPKVAVLTGPGCGPAEIGTALDGWERRLLVAERLGSDAERVTECSPAEAARRTWADPNVVLVLAGSPGSAPAAGKVMVAATITKDADDCHNHHERNGPRLRWAAGGPAAAQDGWALAEERFDSRDAVITKAEVRALALARLAPGPGILVWDVGAGSGSVAVECGRFGAAVIAVERDTLRCERVRANAARHGVDVRVVPGEAPGALGALPDPDAVFVGGGGPAVIEAVAARHPARIVTALAAVERTGPAHAALSAAGYAVHGALVQAARFAPLSGGVHRLAATNPVFLLWATAGQAPGPGTTERAAGPGTTEPVSLGSAGHGPGLPGAPR